MNPRLSKYECSRILGIRASQLAMSAPVNIDVPAKYQGNFLYIAAKELKEGCLDIIIRRPMPFNHFYETHISNLELSDDLDALIAMYEQ